MRQPTRAGTKETSSNAIFRNADNISVTVDFPDTPKYPDTHQAEPANLEQTQELMFSALMEPLCGRSRAQTELEPDERTFSPEFRETAARLIRTGTNLSALEGLELYHRQYWFRLLDSLEEDFPALRRLLGDERFWKALESYLISNPSRSYTLRHLGRAMASHVATQPEIGNDERPWAVAVAALEYALMESAEAAAWPKPEPDDFFHSQLGLQPHVRLVEMCVPAAVWMENEEIDWKTMDPAPSLAVAWRNDEGSCLYVAEDVAAMPLLKAFQEPGTLADIIARADLSDISNPAVLQDWFARWQAHGWFGIPQSPDSISQP